MKRIGITCLKTNLFSSGAIQNALFMHSCFKQFGLDVCYLHSETTEFTSFGIPPEPVVKMDALFPFDQFSHIITVCRVPSVEFSELCDKHNVCLIKYICGNNFMFLMEDFVLKTRSIEDESNDSTIVMLNDARHKFKEIWLYEGLRSQIKLHETIAKIPVRVVPHLWDNTIVRSINMMENPLGLARNNTKFQIIIAESNYTVCKSAFLPLVACETVYVQDSQLIERVHVLCYIKGKKTDQVLDSLTLQTDKKVTVYGRIAMPEALKAASYQFPLIIVSHCMYNPLNYMHYELLQYGYALVHNSILLKEYGYYYPENDIQEAAIQIKRAMREHTQEAQIMQQLRFKNFLCTINPQSVHVQKEYEMHLKRLCLYSNLNGLCYTGVQTCKEHCKNTAPFFANQHIPSMYTSNMDQNSNGVQILDANTDNAILHEPHLQTVFTYLEHITYFVYCTTFRALLLVEDHVVFCPSFNLRLHHVLELFETFHKSYCLKIGYLPFSLGTFPTTGIRYETSCKDTICDQVLYEKVLGTQAVLFTRASAERFLLALGIFCKSDVTLSLVQKGCTTLLKPKPAYQLSAWSDAFASGIPPIDHLLDCANVSAVVPPLIAKEYTKSCCQNLTDMIQRYKKAEEVSAFFVASYA